MENKDKIKFEKEYWRFEDGKVKYFSTFGHYEPYELVKKLNHLENEKAKLSYELHCLKRIKMNLKLIKEDIERIEMLEDNDDKVLSILTLLLQDK